MMYMASGATRLREELPLDDVNKVEDDSDSRLAR
jgi:hypothetical protein